MSSISPKFAHDAKLDKKVIKSNERGLKFYALLRNLNKS